MKIHISTQTKQQTEFDLMNAMNHLNERKKIQHNEQCVLKSTFLVFNQHFWRWSVLILDNRRECIDSNSLSILYWNAHITISPISLSFNTTTVVMFILFIYRCYCIAFWATPMWSLLFSLNMHYLCLIIIGHLFTHFPWIDIQNSNQKIKTLKNI